MLPLQLSKRAPLRRCRYYSCSKALALIWYHALTWYSSPARPLATPDDPRLFAGQQGSPSPACQQLSRARNVCAGGSSEGSTKLKHGTKLGPMLRYCREISTPLQTRSSPPRSSVFLKEQPHGGACRLCSSAPRPARRAPPVPALRL